MLYQDQQFYFYKIEDTKNAGHGGAGTLQRPGARAAQPKGFAPPKGSDRSDRSNADADQRSERSDGSRSASAP